MLLLYTCSGAPWCSFDSLSESPLLVVTHAQYHHTDPLVHTQQIYSYWLACIITGIRVIEVLGILGECSGGESGEN